MKNNLSQSQINKILDLGLKDFSAWVFINHPDKATNVNDLIAEYLDNGNNK